MTDNLSPAARVERSIAAKAATRPDVDSQGRIVGEPNATTYGTDGLLLPNSEDGR